MMRQAPNGLRISEEKFDSELHGSRTMCVHGMEKRAGRQTIVRSGRTILASIAADYVVARIAHIGWIVDTELGVIEHVEGFGTELQAIPVAKGEAFEQRHV